ncbi:MarR family winged helix-turn-helix transcriptional regulator [Nocardia sp. NBC_01388]|uniref:MarR family winged helix-turn-helix transcriptional regulator n=1 Tax=Nocardia sp. NBC_01388 TaxID=2903596 RepID=UPI00324F0AAE
MNDVKKSSGLPGTVAFRLGTLGSAVTDRFAARIESYDLKPKHAGVLTALSIGQAASQQELAALLGVAPSLVVALADHLERLGAIERVRDPADRRRQVLTLTDHGRELLRKCERAARDLDGELTAGLTAAERAAFQRALGVLAAEAGLPNGE